jgi:hypothetical protein
VTTLEPGASEVLTHGLRVRPRSRALRATRPAATITSGLEVLVHEVIAAITTSPWSRVKRAPSYSTTVPLSAGAASSGSAGPPSSTISPTVPATAGADLPKVFSRSCSHCAFIPLSSTRSWGRFGPARAGSTVDMSSSRFEL